MKRNNIIICIIAILILCLVGCQKKANVLDPDSQPSAIETVPVITVEVTQNQEEATTLEETVSKNGLVPLPESEKELKELLEAEEGYSPEDMSKLTDDYFTPETYNENRVDVYMYFSNTDRIYSPGFFPLEACGELIEKTQTWLIDNGLEETKEMKVESGSESNYNGEVSFVFTLDAYPEEKIILFYGIENKTFEYGFLKK